MEHEGRCVGNHVNAYTSDMDFHGGSKLSKLTYPIKTIYSKEAIKRLKNSSWGAELNCLYELVFDNGLRPDELSELDRKGKSE